MQEAIGQERPWAEEVRDLLLQYEFELYERLYYEAYKELIDEGYAGYSLKREYGWDNELVVKRVTENLDTNFRRTVEAGKWDGVANWIWKMKKEVME